MEKDYKKVLKDKRLEAGKLMTEDQMIKCNAAIHTASVASGVAGAIPIPVADAIPISAAQITMVLALGKIFGQELTDAAAKGIIGAAASTFVGRNVVKLIPVAGSIVSAAVAAGVTEAIGWTVAVDFAKNARKEWDRKRNAQDAADAYAEAVYYKSKNQNSSDVDEDVEDFGETSGCENGNEDEGGQVDTEYDLDGMLEKIITHDQTLTVNLPYVVVHKRSLIEYKGNKGYLVWDWLMYNELTFEEIDTGSKTSLATCLDDKKAERLFSQIVEKYGVEG